MFGCCFVFKLREQKGKALSHIKLLPSCAQDVPMNPLNLLFCAAM